MTRPQITSIRLALTVAVLIATSAAHAQQGEDLREASQNPIADLISVPFQNNTNFDIGRSENTQNVLNIQPVYPAHLSESWNLITRPILPVISQPPFLSRRTPSRYGATVTARFQSADGNACASRAAS